MRTLIIALVLLAAAILGLRFLLPRVVHYFVYYPDRLAGDDGSPKRWGLATAESLWLESADGVRLHGWWLPAASRRPHRGAAIYLHGNAGNIASRAGIGLALAGMGLDVLLLDYRGYGLSDGLPSERGLYLDAGAAYRHLREERGVSPDRVLLFGESLGSAVAVDLAVREPVGALVLVSGLSGTVRVAQAHYPWLPSWLFAWGDHRFDAVSRIPELDAPVLILHGGRDRVIPLTEGRSLYDAAPEPKRWHISDQYGHNDLYDDPDVWRAIDRFIEETLVP